MFHNKGNKSPLLDLPRDIFFHILDFTYPEYNCEVMYTYYRQLNETMYTPSNNYSSEIATFMKNFERLMLVNKKIRQWTIFYIKKKYNLFDFFSNIDENFEPNMKILTLSNAVKLTEIINFANGSRRDTDLRIRSLYLFLDILKKSIKNTEILKKVKLYGRTIIDLYSEKMKLSTDRPKEILNKISKKDIWFDFSNLHIVLDVDLDTYTEIIVEISRMINIFRIYSKVDIYFCTFLNFNDSNDCFKFLIKPFHIIFYISSSIDFTGKFISDLLFTTIDLDKFYFETLDNKIDGSRIIDSIINKRIEPILLYIYNIDKDPIIIDDNIKEKIKTLLNNCIGNIDSWKISEDDYLSIIKIYEQYVSTNIKIPMEISDISDVRKIKCEHCQKSLQLHPYYVKYFQYLGYFKHYFCYLYSIMR